MILLLSFSFLAGFITVLSPCILPVLPILLAASIGQGRYRPLGIIIGLILSFSFFTLALTSLVNLLGISPTLLRTLAIILIAFFGLTMLSETLNSYITRFMGSITSLGTLLQEKSAAAGSGFLGGFIFGIAIGLIWTPCAGPILATIATLVATGSLSLKAVAVTLAYSIGTGVPMFLIAYGGNKVLSSVATVSRYAEAIRKIFGIVILLSAVAIAFHLDVKLQQITLQYFPVLNVEKNEAVQKELRVLKPENLTTIEVGTPAPNFVGIATWLNSPPLTIEQLRGKVVLVDFWTYSCINCVRTFPYLKDWYTKYKDKGFVLVGVHTPEFAFEQDVDNVKDAIKRFGIEYPVALDNGYKTWRAYDNNYWPAHYVVDQEGIIRKIHFGEGAYLETENAIRSLLGLEKLSDGKEEQVSLRGITPETYLGYQRASAYSAEFSLQKDRVADYDYSKTLGDNQVGLQGSWLIGPQSIQAERDGATLELNFMAQHVYLVMKAMSPASITALLDGEPLPTEYRTSDMDSEGAIRIDEARMYTILNLKDAERHILTLTFPKGVSAFAFTFGR